MAGSNGTVTARRLETLESDMKLLAWLHAEQTYLLGRAAQQLYRLQVLIAQALANQPTAQDQVQQQIMAALRG